MKSARNRIARIGVLLILLTSGCSTVQSNREIVEKLHQASPYSRALLTSPALSEDVEWWAAGSRERLPWAGVWRGKAGVQEFFRILNSEMDYEKFEAQELIAAGDRVIAIVSAGGHAIRTGRPFESHIVREYRFSDGKIVGVRNFYDTAAYERALASQ
jgi:ketosteroid isomerase-like protein